MAGYIDARDAVWVIDCEQKSGAVAYERAFATVGDKNETVQSTGDESCSPNRLMWRWTSLGSARAVARLVAGTIQRGVCITRGGSQNRRPVTRNQDGEFCLLYP